jgi:hypothetical protein
MCGDNKNSVHKMKYLQDDEAIVVAYCERCKKRYYFRKYQGRIDPKYGKVFRRDTLQPSSNLYYKEYVAL